MKKTLLLMVLLGSLTARAEVVSIFVDGFKDETDCRANAYHTQMVGSMCWGANASNVLAWWQDQLVAQGYNLPKDVPVGTEVYPIYTTTYATSSDDGGRTQPAMNWWITGKSFRTELVEGNGGYYKGLLIQEPGSFYAQENLIGSCGPGETATLEGFSADILDNLANGRALIANLSGSFSITVWGVKYDTESKKITHLFYTDPHDKGSESKIYCGELKETTISGGDSPLPTFYLPNGYGVTRGTIMDIYTLTCKVDEFLTEEAYTDRGSGAFAPFGNVELDNGTSYTISKAVKAAGEDSALAGKANGDLTIKNGTAILADGASIQGKVIFSPGSTEGSRTLSVQADGLTLSSVKVDALIGSNTLDVAEGKALTVTAMEGEGTLVKTGKGTLVNDGTLGNIELQEGTLKGCGTFAAVTVDGGTLIVGNSPGRQEYLGNLSVNLGEIVFSVDGWQTPATEDNCGWASGTYSNIVMHGGSLTLGSGSTLELALGGGAMATLLDNPNTEFNLTIATGFGNSNEFSSELLQRLALQTVFTFSTEDGAFSGDIPQFADGETLKSHITNLEYKLVDDSKLCVSGVYWRETPVVPEPTTGTLGLLALAGLCMRRRKK